MKHISLIRTAKYIGLAATIAGVAVLSPVTASAGGQSVSFCHITESEHNPAVAATISSQGLINGHLGHPDDIIPPFTYNGQEYSQNWEGYNIVIFENGCKVSGNIED